MLDPISARRSPEQGANSFVIPSAQFTLRFAKYRDATPLVIPNPRLLRVRDLLLPEDKAQRIPHATPRARNDNLL